MNTNENRRVFLKKGLSIAAGVGGLLLPGMTHQIFAGDSTPKPPDLVAVKNGEPDIMFNKGIALMGGMKRYVKKGQTVLVKPNIGFNKPPESGATTNPLLVKTIIEHCFGAGAQKVYVFDHEASSSIGMAAKCYKNSGIESAAKQAGAIVAPGDNEKYYQEVDIPGAKILQSTKVHELVLETDVFINVPVLKHHGYTYVTMAMKNLMGVVWDRQIYHSYGLDQSIADFCLFKKPDLNIVDAYRIIIRNGPRGYNPDDLIISKNLLISEDIVAVDTAASKIFGTNPEKIEYLTMGKNFGLGNMNLDELNIKRLIL